MIYRNVCKKILNNTFLYINSQFLRSDKCLFKGVCRFLFHDRNIMCEESVNTLLLNLCKYIIVIYVN